MWEQREPDGRRVPLRSAAAFCFVSKNGEKFKAAILLDAMGGAALAASDISEAPISEQYCLE